MKGSPTKRARMDSDPGSGCRPAGHTLDLFPECSSKRDYLTSVSDFVSTHRHQTFNLESPPGATMTIGDGEDTMYSEDEVIEWGEFYLPNTVSMQVLGVVRGTSCPREDLVLMTCEDRRLYGFDGEKLHLVASSVRQLQYKGIEYPAAKTYYEGEHFKDMTEEDWARVSEGMDLQPPEPVNTDEMLKNLKLLKENIELYGICNSLDCEWKLKNSHTLNANFTKEGPKPGSNPESSGFVETSPTTLHRCNVKTGLSQLGGHRGPERHMAYTRTICDVR